MAQPIPTGHYVTYYDPAKSHHRAWLQAVLERLTQLDPTALQEGSELRDLWKAAVATKAPLKTDASANKTAAAVAADPAEQAAPSNLAAAFAAERCDPIAVALPLIKQFEGCRLNAYPATGHTPWTIGWGSTRYADGRAVQPGDAISEQQADALLISRLQSDHAVLEQTIPAWDTLTPNQHASLLSFSYNCGPRWYGRKGFSTLTACLRQAQLAQVPAALMLYVNPGTPAEAGLRRRRKAEGALWGAAQPHTNPLVGVPYFRQRDSGQPLQRERSCFASSCAMLLETLRPGTLSGPNGDDTYLAVVQRFGDTTSAAAQLSALAHFGVQARLEQQADFPLIERQIARRIPVPCGYLHRGPIHAPRGSGHWLVVFGHTPTHLIVNDPWGEPDLVHGTTLNANGMGLRLTRRNFARRWMVEAGPDGSYRYAPGHGWAVVAEQME